MFGLDRFKNIIENRDQDISDIICYLRENYKTIAQTKLSYNEETPRHRVLTQVFSYLYKKDNEIKKFIDERLQNTVRETVHSLVTGDDGVCKNGNKKNYYKIDFKYRFCANECACFKEARKNTCLEKYGHDHHLKSSEILSKQEKTNLEKYGEVNVSKLSSTKEKIKKTNLEKYGYESHLSSPEIKQKKTKTNIEKYGVSCPIENKEILYKRNINNIEKFGGTAPIHNIEVKNKIENTNLEKFGVFSFSQINYSHTTKDILFNKENFLNFMMNKSISSAANILNVDASTICNYCKKYDISIGLSSYETEIEEFLKSISITYIKNTRSIISPLELDFYLPDFKLAIEFNGLYWHSDKFVDKNYHLNKYLACEDKKIRLIMINEDEWITRSESIKRKILNLCGKSEKGTGARKLSMRKIDNKEAHAFVEKYHIQGKTGTAIASYGAFDKNELVAVVQYNKQRGTQDVELIRFCTNGKLYAGVFSRLFKYSVEQEGYEQVISFADLRYSDGNVYEKNGFIKDRVIRPDYRYFKNMTTYHKSTFTKANIAKKFELDMTNLTEKQAMNELGYNRIYDCGKIKYIWSNIDFVFAN